MSSAACTCLIVRYDPIHEAGGFRAERWSCKKCGRIFQPVDVADAARQERDVLATRCAGAEADLMEVRAHIAWVGGTPTDSVMLIAYRSWDKQVHLIAERDAERHLRLEDARRYTRSLRRHRTLLFVCFVLFVLDILASFVGSANAADRCEPTRAVEEHVCLALQRAASEGAVLPGVVESVIGDRLGACIEVVHGARIAGLPPALVASLAWHESRLEPRARSSGGATGLLQVVPSQRRRYEKRSRRSMSPDSAGYWTLARWLGRHRDVEVAVAAYNAGAVRQLHHYQWARGVIRLALRIEEAM